MSDKVLIDREALLRIHRDLDACQKTIWLAGVRPRGYGFDPAYVNDAQARLKEIDALLAAAPAAPAVQQPVKITDQTAPDGLYAVLYRDNWDGQGDTYHLLARKRNGVWFADESGKELFEYKGDAILRIWPLDADAPPAHPDAALVAPKSLTSMVDAAMVEMKNISPPLRRSECERLIRAALAAQEGK